LKNLVIKRGSPRFSYNLSITPPPAPPHLTPSPTQKTMPKTPNKYVRLIKLKISKMTSLFFQQTFSSVYHITTNYKSKTYKTLLFQNEITYQLIILSLALTKLLYSFQSKMVLSSYIETNNIDYK
jgi:hypothetical protein